MMMDVHEKLAFENKVNLRKRVMLDALSNPYLLFGFQTTISKTSSK
jgi:hypothetical protein